MINYDPKAWVKVTLSYAGTVIPRIVARVGFLAGLTLLLYLIYELVGREEKIWTPFKSSLGHTLVGVALGLLVVFRNNCSYDRYWEGRKLWGAIINTSRNLLRGAAAYVGECKDLANLVGAYVLALKQHLRNNKDISEIK